MCNLIPLISAGIIEVKLGKNHWTLMKDAPNLKERIYDFCGKKYSALRKKRTRG